MIIILLYDYPVAKIACFGKYKLFYRKFHFWEDQIGTTSLQDYTVQTVFHSLVAGQFLIASLS